MTRNDADNTPRAILDALNGLAYDDDKQVTSLVVRKHDRTRIERPFVIFDVMPI